MKWIHISCMHITCANNLANRIIWYAVYENVLKSPCILIIAFVCVCTKRNQRSNTYCREWETESAKKRRADNEQIQTNWLDKIQFYMYKYDKIMMAHNKSPMSMLSIGSSSSRTPSPLPKDVTQAIAAATAAVDESSESENETEPAKIFHRRLSTNAKSAVSNAPNGRPFVSLTTPFHSNRFTCYVGLRRCGFMCGGSVLSKNS